MERDGNGNFGLVEIGHIINEREHLAGVNEPQRGRISGRHDSRMADSVKTAIGRRQRAIDWVGVIPLVALVRATGPRHPGFGARSGISLAHADAFVSAYLFQGKRIIELFAEAHPVELYHYR